nr:hypothetical protein [Burkholderia cepacia]
MADRIAARDAGGGGAGGLIGLRVREFLSDEAGFVTGQVLSVDGGGSLGGRG